MNATASQGIASRYAAAREQLAAVGQDHVLHFWDQLDDAGRSKLLDEIEGVDWPEVNRLVKSHVLQKPQADIPDHLEPAPFYPHTPAADQAPQYESARELGESLTRQGKVAAFTVAGGQGTRLGWQGPKGTFPATPVRGTPLFGCLADYIHCVQKKYGCIVPWYVMTSPVNDADTRAFFKEQDHFGLDPANIMLFPQAMMPALDMVTGKVLLAAPHGIALSPNGHGGSLKALDTSGALDDMDRRGVEQISYVQVDNPIVKVIDPLFIGLHATDGAQMSSKMLPKAFPKEKLGNFCMVDGRIRVIEYSNLPDELAEQRREDGSLRFLAGSIAIHVIRADFVRQLNERAEGFALPFHRAEKKVPHIDLSTGALVAPVEPNAIKLETFVFDALPMCETSIVYETQRAEEFAPIKNADAATPEVAVDSPQSSKLIQIERAARWLESAGVAVPRDDEGQPSATLEISQRTAVEPEDLKGLTLPEAITPQTEFCV